ncbi:MAG: MFS transporter [Actinomycetota bacterium]
MRSNVTSDVAAVATDEVPAEETLAGEVVADGATANDAPAGEASEIEPEAKAEQSVFRRLFPILFIVFIDGMGVTILVPVLPFYAIAFGAGPATVGLLLASYALAQMLFSPVLGRLSDRFGRKPVLLTAQVGTFASLLLLGFATALPLIFLSRILDGITGANQSTAQSAVSDMTTSKDRAAGLGLVGAATGLGFIAGPLLSGLALAAAGSDYRAPAFLAAAFSLTSIVLTARYMRETLATENRREQGLRGPGWVRTVVEGIRSRQLGGFYLFALAVQLIFAMFTATFALFTLNRLGFDSLSNAIFLGLFGVMLVAMQGVFVGRLVRRFGEYRVLAASLVMTTTGFGLASFAPQQAVPWYSRSELAAELGQHGEAADQLALLPPEAGAGLGAFIFVLFALAPGPLGYTLQLPTINALLTNRVGPSEYGQTLGVSAVFVGAGTVLGPLLGGYLFARFAPGTPYLISAVLSVLLLIVLLTLVRNPSSDPNVASSR